MATIDSPRTYPTLPHPRRRVPIIGDVFAFDMDTPSQSAIALAAELGPIYELKALGSRYVVAAGGDVVMDVNDETPGRDAALPGHDARRRRGVDRAVG